MAVAKYNAIIRYQYQLDPDKLSLKEWAKLASEWEYIQELKGLRFKSNLTEVIANFLIEIFKKDGK